MPGPLPNPNRRRRNAPTIPTTKLPARGRKGRAPKVPAAYKLNKAGRAWWAWAWKLPQAAAWDAGALYALARRAQLEDDLVALEIWESCDLAELLGVGDNREATKRLEYLLRKLKAMAGGRVGLMREMRELDNRFGLNPKGMADLRWQIEAEEEQQKPTPQKGRPRLRAVETATG